VVCTREKCAGGSPSRQIEAKVKREYDGIGPHAATIRRYVNANLAGMSPLKIGVKGGLPQCVFKLLCIAFESFVRIQQINSCQGENSYKKLAARINTLLRHDYRQKMLQRILLATAKDLDASMMHIAEDRRVRWTTFANISIWFATRDANDGKVTIPPEQLYLIINFDEMCLSVDGSKGRRGGRPAITLHDPRLPYTGKITNKDSLTGTLVMGSNAVGKAFPPHFQYQTKATIEDRERVRAKVFLHCPRVLGKFGTDTETSWDCTFGLNTKGGMDDCEFEQHVMNSILPLYPNTRNRPGHRLLLKCDSGPGRLQIELLAKLRFLGVYLYPCVPNTTAVIQETDHTYGLFKSRYRQNLELLIDECVQQDLSVSVPQYKHGLLVFGGIDADTKLELELAFEIGFSHQWCLDLWEKVGAAPLTRKCLDEPQVRKSIDMDNDYAFLGNSVQEANEYAVYSLTEASDDGSALQALVAIKPTERRTSPITERMSRERIELLACANTHGKKIFATGGSHVCSDDFFKAQALLAREEDVAMKIKLKKSLQQKSELHEKGTVILVEKAECFESNNYRNVSTKELDVLLNWCGVKKKAAKKAEKVAMWREIRAASTKPPMADVWTAKDKEELVKLRNKEIDIC
jgi:hypothetical protein